jgi:hypothetical protein
MMWVKRTPEEIAKAKRRNLSARIRSAVFMGVVVTGLRTFMYGGRLHGPGFVPLDQVASRISSAVVLGTIAGIITYSRREDGVVMPWTIFLSAPDNGRQHAAEVRTRRVAFAGHKIIRAQPHAALSSARVRFWRNQTIPRPLATACGTAGARWARWLKFFRRVHRRAPVRLRQIAAEKHAARAPGIFRKAGHLQNQVALLLRQRFQLRQSVRFNSGIAACGGSGAGSTSQV